MPRPNSTHSLNVTHCTPFLLSLSIPPSLFTSFLSLYHLSSPDPGPPPYSPGSFDRVLLDAPCSALGQRPQATCHLKLQELLSYPPYQKMLIKQVGSLFPRLLSSCCLMLVHSWTFLQLLPHASSFLDFSLAVASC